MSEADTCHHGYFHPADCDICRREKRMFLGHPTRGEGSHNPSKPPEEWRIVRRGLGLAHVIVPFEIDGVSYFSHVALRPRMPTDPEVFCYGDARDFEPVDSPEVLYEAREGLLRMLTGYPTK